ncbi:heme ABC transporter ATP-binding protein [Alkalilimnicola ehrlichii]|uniref:Heme ABC transporter ATP-binding protein n=1 Tax=Alkalilimnicola ehrlichii TaxID=351052 RepID=A0A3E0WTP5_9GAMM|nr:heme ABC transporter ATP-binding protein [Alkalilimnicola ehrlichii]RFA27193.1 heme ABC transporter ATP-binding protein [Alkalilimnicola ehrlichii]RFA35365.1 heme ABC transporter ATP-binding protein [Alkalilimnicola ehrlichii]
MLSAQRVSVRTAGRHLLREVSLSVRPGEFVAVLGPNGAGKSTLLKTLVGEQKPTHGQVSMHGRRLQNWHPRERARLRAVLPQELTLRFAFTALEVVLMGRMPHIDGVETAHDYRIARDALGAVDALALSQRLFPTLSGGERQRVQLARVLAQIWEPTPLGERFLLLDEPTAALDPAHQHATLHLARELTRQNVGVLAVLHDLNLAAQYADRVALLKDGAIHTQGDVYQALTAAAINAVFDIHVEVLEHPTINKPLVIYSPRGRQDDHRAA